MTEHRRTASKHATAQPQTVNTDADEAAAEAEAAQAAELSRAAREAVRQPPDPRLERQLARMGLAPDDAADEPSRPAVTAGSVSTAASVSAADPSHDEVEELRSEVSGLRTEVEQLRASLDGASSRIRALTAVVAVQGIAVVVLAVLALAG